MLSGQVVRTQALTVLLALLAADPGSVILDAIYASGLPSRVLLDLVETPHRSLLQVSLFPCTVIKIADPCLRLLHSMALHTYI